MKVSITTASVIYKDTNSISPEELSLPVRLREAKKYALQLQGDSRVSDKAVQESLAHIIGFAQPLYGGSLVEGLANIPSLDLPTSPGDPLKGGVMVTVRHAES